MQLTENSDHRQTRRVANRLISIAEKDNNKLYLAYGLYYSGVSDILMGNPEQGLYSLNKSLSKARELGNDTLLVNIYNAFGISEADKNNYTLAFDNFYKALKYAMKLGDDKKMTKIEINLAHALQARNDTSGIRYVKDAYERASMHSDRQLAVPSGYYYAYFQYMKGLYRDAENIITHVIKLAESIHYKEMASLYKLQGDVVFAQGNLKYADVLLHKALETAHDAQAATIAEIYLSLARISAARGNLADSNRIADEGVRQASDNGVYAILPEFFILQSQNYELLGNPTEALKFHKRHQEISDSVYQLEKERAIKELTIKYDVDKKENELEHKGQILRMESKKNTIYAIASAVLAVLLLVVFVMYKKQRNLYKAIALQNKNALRQNELLRDSVKADPKPADPSLDVQDEAQVRLFRKVCRVMELEKLYTDPDLTRDSLARTLETNRSYLSAAINKNAGVAFSQFINGYRIQEAVRILSDGKKRDYPLKAIAQDVGFSSMTTFYKQFQTTMGMTPSAYRKTVISNEPEK